jgi:hypothetical protein
MPFSRNRCRSVFTIKRNVRSTAVNTDLCSCTARHLGIVGLGGIGSDTLD